MSDDYTIHLPPFVPIRRPDWQISLDDVRSAADLPPYLFLGQLDASSFDSSKAGWSATWRRDESTWFRLHFDAKSGTIEARDAWLGLDGCITDLGTPDLSLLTKMRFMWPVESWEEKAEEELQTRWNLKYVQAKKGDTLVAGLPDGLMKTLLLPVPVELLPILVETFIGFREDATMDFPVNGYVTPAMGAVNYVEGKNPEWAQDPEELFLRTLVATGLPPADLPVREVAESGSAAWTVRRIACMSFLAVPFAGLIPLLGRLEAAGLVSVGPMASGDGQPGLDSVEFSGCVVQAGKEFETETIAWFSPDGKRRVFWKMPQDHIEVFQEQAAHRDDDLEVPRRAAAEIVARSKEWLRQALEV